MSAPELARRLTDEHLLGREEFERRVRTEAETLKSELRSGTFDNPQPLVGLEFELYGVDRDRSTLRRIPRPLLKLIGFEEELGLHNAEMHTSPQPLNSFGISCQQTEVQSRLAAAQEEVRSEGMTLVSDGFWTIPPTGEDAMAYLDDSVEHEGVRIATNMSKSLRYHWMSNSDLSPRLHVETPHVDFEADTVVPESLTTSIQPHYQIPDAEQFPTYFRYALRVAGPVLALGVNSPFFPPECYGGASAGSVLDDHWMENRIPTFEGIMNPIDAPAKVRFPGDVDSVFESVDRIVADEPLVPMDKGEGGRFDDQFRHLDHKRGTYWRWVRPVFAGETPRTANVRVEFRPLPAQPTVRDAVAFLALFAGLMEGLAARNHPVVDLSWERARENFYAAMRDGLDAEFVWIDADGNRTAIDERIYAELFEFAEHGLTTRGLPRATAKDYLRPLRGRYRREVTPAGWKHERVRERVAAGESLGDAIEGMQREYIDRQDETVLTGTFLDWLESP